MRIQEVISLSEKKQTRDRGKASRKLCASPKKLGASDQSSCVAQGLRSRNSGKKHKGKSIDGRKVKAAKYGGPLKDYS
jgi:hypothetical protein